MVDFTEREHEIQEDSRRRLDNLARIQDQWLDLTSQVFDTDVLNLATLDRCYNAVTFHCDRSNIARVRRALGKLHRVSQYYNKASAEVVSYLTTCWSNIVVLYHQPASPGSQIGPRCSIKKVDTSYYALVCE